MQKVFARLLFIVLSVSSLCASEFPENLSENACISILSVNYSDFSHSIFSKSCLRIYDKQNNFDEVIDFACFDDFDDKFFALNFFLKEKRAFIRTEPFFEYFMARSGQKNISLIESKLNLSVQELKYIYDFIYLMHRTFPDYSYDFDILTNNSETHISQILHDCYRMTGNTDESIGYLFSDINKHSLSYRKLGGDYVLLPKKESIELDSFNLAGILKGKQDKLNKILMVLSLIILSLTAYQVLVYFFDKIYVNSVFKTIQIMDFLILFCSGLSGILIIFENIFSDQTMFSNDFKYLFLIPPHIFAAFKIFTPIKSREIRLKYWSLSACLILVYLIICRMSPAVILVVLPVFMRVGYFYFVTLDIKKGHKFKPYVLLVRFLDFMTS